MMILLEGVPLTIEILFLLWALLIFGGYFGSVYWVYRDAAARGADHPAMRAFWALLPFGVFGYLFNRSGIGERETELTTSECAVLSLVVAVFLALAISAVVTPPDPFTQVIYGTGFLPFTLLLSYFLFFLDGYRRLREYV